ncbi:MAG: TadE/TadG family type IV pilus assembly protein [Dehalococcoidia bacterium]
MSRSQAAFEFVLVLPIFIAFMLVVVDMGIH